MKVPLGFQQNYNGVMCNSTLHVRCAEYFIIVHEIHYSNRVKKLIVPSTFDLQKTTCVILQMCSGGALMYGGGWKTLIPSVFVSVCAIFCLATATTTTCTPPSKY